MSILYEKMGMTLKLIRTSKNYTQNYIAENKMSRSMYAKVEAGNIIPTITKYNDIINKLDMTHTEFLYICNKYNYDFKNKIIYDFKKLSNNNETKYIVGLSNKCLKFLEESTDIIVKDIFYVCQSMLSLKDDDETKAIQFATIIWNRLSNLDTWYLIELRLLNNILYLFPTETAQFMAQKGLIQLEKYNLFEEQSRLKMSFMINYVVLQMKDNQFNLKLIDIINELISQCRYERQYDILSVAFVRKGIILNKLGNFKESKENIDRGLNIIDSIELNDLRAALIKEINDFSKI